LAADDYVPNPFSAARTGGAHSGRARRRNDAPSGETSTQSGLFHCGDITLDVARRVVTKSNEELPVNPKEFAILELLMKARGAALSRERILDVVWAGDFYGDARQLDVYIYRLREKLGEGIIETARGFGYRVRC
jgi:two-component system alkaline phosphatase synthesis response regulator PhoP